MAGVLLYHLEDSRMESPSFFRQRPMVVSHTGRSWGQQWTWSSQQMALSRGQQAQVKQ